MNDAIRFHDGTLTLGANKQIGWQFQLYVPKLRIERTYIDKEYVKTRIVGFNVQADTSFRFVVHNGRGNETAFGFAILGFGAAAQYVGAPL